MQIRNALEQATRSLRRAGVDSPRLDAELLLAHVLELTRASLLAHPDRPLTIEQFSAYRCLVDRRKRREPLAYIVGHREFFGLEFAVDPRVLIPRPETELLVERALGMARQLPDPLIADVGVGSGAIAVSLVVYLPAATIYALDSSAEALAVTVENARRHGVAERVRCLQGDLLQPLPRPVNLVVANLPYVARGERSELAPEIRDYEPAAALDGGRDGLDCIRRLLATAAPHLLPGGALLLEIGAGQGPAVKALAHDHFPQARLTLLQDYAGLDRILVVET